MKSLIIFFAVSSSLFTDPGFANKESIATAVLKSFRTSFATVKEVDWSVTENYYKARFALNSQYINAYFNKEAELIAMTKNISSFQLPMTLQTSFRKKHINYWVSDLFEIANEEGTSYYITLENADNKVILRSTNNSPWRSFQRIAKNRHHTPNETLIDHGSNFFMNKVNTKRARLRACLFDMLNKRPSYLYR